MPTLSFACVWQALHRLEVRVNRGAEGKSGKVFVGNLSEDRAMDLAGKFISEAFVWGVGSSPAAAFVRLLSRVAEALNVAAYDGSLGCGKCKRFWICHNLR